MLRFFVVGALFTVIASAYALYSINTTTRSIADDVKEKERLREELISSMAILKAERAYLSRPEVIEPLARRYGMRPVKGEQLIDRSQLPRPAHTREAR
ncbi:MAG: cell division protein FtsL [Hyphomicrobiaceae bacterium]|nr:cell division protein FtsL [Hyphomicrobiaceae bacterium]